MLLLGLLGQAAVCVFFATQSGCSKGDTCTSLHVEVGVLLLGLLGQAAVCAFFATQSGCSKADTCAFLYVEVGILDAAAQGVWDRLEV